MSAIPPPNVPAGAVPCPAFFTWQRAVYDHRYAGCLSCWCFRRCGCGKPEPWPYVRGRCAGCGARLVEVWTPRARVLPGVGVAGPLVLDVWGQRDERPHQ